MHLLKDKNTTRIPSQVTSTYYIVMLKTYQQHRLKEMAEENDLEDVWLQDGATEHTA